MTTQQLLEMLRTWPECESMPLDWLEQYPPDTPIMDALPAAPCGGVDVGDQWLISLDYCAMERLSKAHRQFFEKQTVDADEVLRAAWQSNGEKLEADRARAWIRHEFGGGEAAEKAHRNAMQRAWDKRYKADHAALVEYIQATNGLFEQALESLYQDMLLYARQ